ncbi:MAG: type I phosphomannose isomerase catalytic subunit [Chthoniobacterales bacterium]
MAQDLKQPITFQPIFMERIWGGRRLDTKFGKALPPQKRIGESWEVVDREEAQSVVANGPLRGTSLHDLWQHHRNEIFGAARPSDRFPILIKLLDAQDKLSLQVHPPPHAADQLGSECKTEFWYVAAADPGAKLFVGLNKPMTRQAFEKSIHAGTIADCVHSISVETGDAMFLPSGRFHALGAGSVIVEIQQNSDTTYRVFDWNRVDETGEQRQLHVAPALQCIDFDDVRPELVRPDGETLVQNELFEVQKWQLAEPREIAATGEFAFVCCLTGRIECAGVEIAPGGFMLIPASLSGRLVKPMEEKTSLLRVTIPA